MKLHSIAVNDKKTGQGGGDIKREGPGGGGHLNYSNNRRSYVGEAKPAFWSLFLLRNEPGNRGPVN